MATTKTHALRHQHNTEPTDREPAPQLPGSQIGFVWSQEHAPQQEQDKKHPSAHVPPSNALAAFPGAIHAPSLISMRLAKRRHPAGGGKPPSPPTAKNAGYPWKNGMRSLASRPLVGVLPAIDSCFTYLSVHGRRSNPAALNNDERTGPLGRSVRRSETKTGFPFRGRHSPISGKCPRWGLPRNQVEPESERGFSPVLSRAHGFAVLCTRCPATSCSKS